MDHYRTVEQVKAEFGLKPRRALVIAANRELIARFEKKILATLARVWGEEDMTLSEV
jgi:hypothetical protein